MSRPGLGLVKDSWSRLERVLVCPPDHFSFQPINVITQAVLARGETADLDRFRQEHRGLVEAYRSAGVVVEQAESVAGLPYMVYARDFGACLEEGVLIGRFREPVRRGETARYENKLREMGLPILGRISRGFLEGGDFWYLDETTIVWGVIARSTLEGVENAAEILAPLGYHVIPVRCPAENLHLDMCFNIVAERVAVAAPAVLPDWFLQTLRKRRFEIVAVPRESVFKHHCNVQALGNGRVLSFEANRVVNRALQTLGLEVVTCHLEEILKGGGGPHCLTFPLQRAE